MKTSHGTWLIILSIYLFNCDQFKYLKNSRFIFFINFKLPTLIFIDFMKTYLSLIVKNIVLILILFFTSTTFAQISSNEFNKENLNNWINLVKVDPTGNVFREAEIRCFYIFRNELYAAGNFQGINYKKINGIAKFDGINWTQVGNIDKNVVVNSLVEYKGELYAGGSWGIKKWDGNKWESFGLADEKKGYSKGQMLIDVIRNGTIYVRSLCVYKDELYAGGTPGLSGTSNASLLRWNGNNWRSAGGKFLELQEISNLIVYNDDLYIGSEREWYNKGDTDYILLVKWDGYNTTKVSFDKPKGSNYDIYHNSSLVTYGDHLYITYGKGGGQGGIFKFDGSKGENIYEGVSVRSMTIFRNKIFFYGSYIDRLLMMGDAEKVKMFEVPLPSNRGVLGVYMNKIYGMTEVKL